MATYFPHYACSLRGQIDASVELLRELVDAGVPVFALTNWSAETFHHARERFDFLALFDDIVVSGVEGVAKPDRAIFAEMLRRTSTSPGRTFFADDGRANVEGAGRAGLDAALFTGAEALRDERVRQKLLR